MAMMKLILKFKNCADYYGSTDENTFYLAFIQAFLPVPFQTLSPNIHIRMKRSKNQISHKKHIIGI